ncbi:alpha/beta fold hydrolase [Paucimonas lemoignei]|uniref:alpha/beta fold hydrolase n=1 Tax=Paucimonas lemoignei TaxID=29443 RepID=UPI001A9CBD1F|nr:alpha/beta hydrolase [Paucimonas lemoignei]
MLKHVKLCDGDAGKPALLCLPGAMCSPEVFAAMAESTGYIGYGVPWLESEGPFDLVSLAQRVSELIDQLGKVILVGHSVGTVIAVLAARQCMADGRNSVAGLVLSNSGANTRGLGDIDSLIDKVSMQWGTAFWEAFSTRCIGTDIPPQLMERLQAYPAQLNPSAVAESLASLKAIDLLPVLPSLAGIPAAVVHGRFDKARTMAHATELAGALPASSLHVLETGHTSAAEAPAAFAGIVQSVADRILI